MSDDERPRAAWLVVGSDATWRLHDARQILPPRIGQILSRVDEFDEAARVQI